MADSVDGEVDYKESYFKCLEERDIARRDYEVMYELCRGAEADIEKLKKESQVNEHTLMALSALEVAQRFCNSFTADECPDTVAVPINEAVNTLRKYLGKSYFAKDGTLLNADGTRSIFDDVDA